MSDTLESINEHEQPEFRLLDETNIIANPSIENFKKVGLEIQEMIHGQIDRPTLSTHADRKLYGEKKYIAITEAQQKMLGIKSFGDTVFAVLRKSPNHGIYLDLYLASGIASDEMFMERATKGLYQDQGIANASTMESILRNNPLQSASIAVPFYNAQNQGDVVGIGVLDLGKMLGNNIHSRLIASEINDDSYPASLVRKWANLDSKDAPIIVLPNSFIKALGGKMRTSTNLPSETGNTIAEAQTAIMNINGSPQTVTLVGALDKIGYSSQLNKLFTVGKTAYISLQVGSPCFRITQAS